VLRLLRVVALLLVLALPAACRGTDSAPKAPGDAVVVASFDFAESELLAEIYAQALENADLPVRRELRLGSRELVLPALRRGLVDVVPEYLGSALAAVGVAAKATDTTQARARLDAALRPEGLQALTPAAAQNANGLAVTLETARRLHLTAISDLRAHASALVLGGPTECPRRPYCLAGLRSTYGLAFGRFVAYDRETQRVTALEEGVVDVAVIFTTDGLLAARDLVLLADDRRLQPVENVVPIVSQRAVTRYGARVASALDAVSARLDSAALPFLKWRDVVEGHDAHAEARAWLLRQGLVPR
jgi:osmoprotectant transport system substrate-binding protein